MKTAELIKILKKNGCFFVEHGKEHDKWHGTTSMCESGVGCQLGKAGAFFRIIEDALFRYFGKCCSDIIGIVPLKWYTISQIGGIIYVYDSKTGF